MKVLSTFSTRSEVMHMEQNVRACVHQSKGFYFISQYALSTVDLKKEIHQMDLSMNSVRTLVSSFSH
jgi:hypothetical protein